MIEAADDLKAGKAASSCSPHTPETGMAEAVSEGSGCMSGSFIIVNLNAKLQPMHRAEIYEEPLEEKLAALSIGEVTGGGTLQGGNGEIINCDIEIEVPEITEENLRLIQGIMEDIGAPKGSKLLAEPYREIPIGIKEGLAVYLNGSILPENVYQECDAGVVMDTFNQLLNKDGAVYSYWQGPTETALYLYGRSSDEMRTAIQDFVDAYPLCQGCRIEKIA